MADDKRDFWSKVARDYDRVVDLQIGPQTRLMVRQRLAQEGRLGHLAEFGCGTGFYTELLASKADSVVATDFSPGMLAIAKSQIRAANVTFQSEDVQRTSFGDAVFDTAFMSLLIHFTRPEKTVTEMRRILKPGGVLIICNLDLGALSGLDRIRCLIRIVYHGVFGYRLKPPKGFVKHVLTEQQLCHLLRRAGFESLSTETIRDTSRSSNIPVEYIRAVKI